MAKNEPSTAPGNGGASGTSACTGGVDSTSTPSAPPSLVPVTAIDLCTAAMSMDYRNVPLHDVHRWHRYTEKTETIPFLEWCEREVKRLRAIGRAARVVIEDRPWGRVCYVIATVPPHITLLQKLKEARS